MKTSIRVLMSAFCILFLGFLSQVHAQSNGSSISGFVFGEGKKPVEGASIVMNNTNNGFISTAISDQKGYFIVRELPVGIYSIRITDINSAPQVINGLVLNFGDHLVLQKINLTAKSNTLSEVVVKSNSFMNSVDRLGTSTAVSSKTLQKLPNATRHYTDMMFLSPLASGSTLQGSKAGGVGYMLDGVSNRRATFGKVTDAAFSISSETIREFEISTNDYNVTAGRGSGGLVKAITKSGTNTFAGSVWGYYGANSLAAKRDVNGNPITSIYEVKQFGALSSGPIIKDKLHYIVSYDEYTNTIPFRAYDFNFSGATKEQAEKNLGITEANLKSIVDIMEKQFGFPVMQQYGVMNIIQKTQNAFVKFDWNINKKNLFTLKYNYLHFIDPNKIKGSGLLSTQYTGIEVDHSLMASLRTEVNTRTTNELKIQFSTYRKFLTFLGNRVPEGFVNVTSTFADGSKGTKTVAFGNQNWVPETDASNVLQIVDYLRVRKGNINYVFGTDNNINLIKDQLTHDQQGQFYYNSITDMTNNNPYRFNRKIPLNGTNPPVRVPLIELGLFAQMETNLRPNLNLTAGIRWDGQIIGSAPTYNELLYQDLGLNTHVVPFDAKNIQPRFNLTWDVHSNGMDIVKFGAGLFASELTTQPITFAHIDNGVDFRQIDIRTNVPIPDWKAYQNNFDLVPGVAYYNSLTTKQPATVLLMDKNLKTPLTFKTSLSYYHYFNSTLRVGANLYFNTTWNNFYLYDLNLRKYPSFITNEGRYVYVPVGSLTATGTNSQPNLINSRISTNFNQVRYFTNTSWASKYLATMLEVAQQIGKDGSLSVSYAYGKATGTPPYDNGDPRNANFSVGTSYWDYASYGKNWMSDGDQRHNIVALFSSPTIHGFNITSSFQAYQNAHYTVNVNKDVIGEGNDGQDLAYIFDPNDSKTPSGIAADMNKLLAQTSPEFKKFLESNFGKFAPYNGGLMPWRTQWNMSLSYNLKVKKTNNLTFRADIFNVLNLLNPEWGYYSQIGNTSLYSLSGFDATTNSFNYAVNTNAGTKTKTANYYSVQFGIRYSF